MNWKQRLMELFGLGENWRVLYPCGQWSRRMRLTTAEDYAGIFGGRVRFADEFQGFPMRTKTVPVIRVRGTTVTR